MDVQQWLQNTEARAPPDSADGHHRLMNSTAAAAPPHHHSDHPRVRKQTYRSKRRRVSSRESQLGIRGTTDHRLRELIPAGQAPSSAGWRDDHSPSTGSQRSPPCESSSLVHHHHHHKRGTDPPPQKNYTRRARHKTRPDRYEPKESRQRRSHEEDRSQHKRRKSRRRRAAGDGDRTVGLVQGFRLRAGPKNGRLTLKSDTAAGVFKHGRASAQMTACGGGGGLPDLVFNEMRFLQKPKEHQDQPASVVPDPAPRKNRKSDRKDYQGEEISAYFSGLTGGKTEQARDKTAPVHSDARAKARPGRSAQALEHIDLPDKPFLGFGGRASPPEARNAAQPSSSYFTWSESEPVRHQSQQEVPWAKPVTPVVFAGELSTARQAATNVRSSCQKLPSSPPCDPLEQSRGSNGAASSQSSSDLKLSQLKARLRAIPLRDTPSVSSLSSQSLPKKGPKESGPNAKPSISSPQRGYHTSDILRVNSFGKAFTATSPHPRSPSKTQQIPLQSDKENIEPYSSTPLGNMIRQVHTTLTKPAMAHGPSPIHIEVQQPRNVPDLRQHGPRRDQNIKRQDPREPLSTLAANTKRQYMWPGHPEIWTQAEPLAGHPPSASPHHLKNFPPKSVPAEQEGTYASNAHVTSFEDDAEMLDAPWNHLGVDAMSGKLYYPINGPRGIMRHTEESDPDHEAWYDFLPATNQASACNLLEEILSSRLEVNHLGKSAGPSGIETGARNVDARDGGEENELGILTDFWKPNMLY